MKTFKINTSYKGIVENLLSIFSKHHINIPCKFIKINFLACVHLSWMNLHNSCSGFLGWSWKLDLSVQTARSQKSRIQYIYSICCSNNLNISWVVTLLIKKEPTLRNLVQISSDTLDLLPWCQMLMKIHLTDWEAPTWFVELHDHQLFLNRNVSYQ